MKKTIKKIITIIILVVFVYFIYDNYYNLLNGMEYIYTKYIQTDIRQTLIDNKYRKRTNYDYLKIYESTKIKSKEDARNAIYTMVDAGWDDYTVKCEKDYERCLDEVRELTEDDEYISSVSNYSHPFNTIENIKTTFKSTGIIQFHLERRYKENDIKAIEEKVNEIYNKYYDSSKNVRENIKIFHDYIIKNASYDMDFKPYTTEDETPTNAYGVLINGKGICSSYADAMSLFLEKMHVNNFRISSETHEWNVVYVEGNWYHLDLTWDDPTNSNDPNYVGTNYFLLTYNELKDLTDEEHIFDKDIYIEAQ